MFAGGLIFLLRRYWSGTKKRARIHLTPAEREKKDGKKKPPFWTRIALILSAIGVAFRTARTMVRKALVWLCWY